MRFFHQDTFGTDGTVVANDFFGRIPPLTERFAQSGLLADVTPTGGPRLGDILFAKCGMY